MSDVEQFSLLFVAIGVVLGNVAFVIHVWRWHR